MATQREMVDHISSVLRQAGKPVPKSTLYKCFPGQWNPELYGVYMHIASDNVHNALVAIDRRRPKDDHTGKAKKPPKPKKSKKGKGDRKEDVQQAGRQCAEAHTEPFVIIPPELGPDDCPCGCKGGRLSLKCPNCDEIMW